MNKNGLEIDCEAIEHPLTPINIDVNTYKQNRTRSINTEVKDIIKNNNINYNNWKLQEQRDYSDFNWNSLYANNV